MNKNPTLRAGTIIDRWKLISFLGAGGNAEVWIARSDHEEVALKILTRNWRDRNSEPRLRFSAEIHAMRKIGHHSGVIPLLDANDTSTKSRPWLAMPIATSLSEALGEAPTLANVVVAIAKIANTLADLFTTHGIAHRDIKPGNLLHLEGKPKVSDFGLVKLPDAASLTEEGKILGPQNYIAPELFTNSHADPGPADVFSLAKTFWVLATHQPNPVPGKLYHDYDSTKISRYIVARDPNPRQIELLLANATDTDPSARLTMREFSEELYAWNQPAREIDTARVVERLRRRARLTLVPHSHKTSDDESSIARFHELAGYSSKVLQETAIPLLVQYNLVANKSQTIPENGYGFPSLREPDFPEGILSQAGPVINSHAPLNDRVLKSPHLALLVHLALSKKKRTSLIGAIILWDMKGWRELVWQQQRVEQSESAKEFESLNAVIQEMLGAISDAVSKLLDRVDTVTQSS